MTKTKNVKFEFDQASYEDMLATLQTEQYSVADLAKRYEVTDRTIYRWIKYAEADGWVFIKRGNDPTIYQIEVPT